MTSPLLGSPTPRLWTPALADVDQRANSTGHHVIEFASKVLGIELNPWQKWLLIHALELKPDGSPRFRYVLVLVARQAGKSLVAEVLSLYWLYVQRRPLILGTSTTVGYAKVAWDRALASAQKFDPKVRGVQQRGEVQLITRDGCGYRIAAPNRRAGRSLTVHNLICDELRELRDETGWEAWAAANNAMNAVKDAQAWCFSNAGDDTSLVLNHFREAALAGSAPGWGIFEWSAPDGMDVTDRSGWAMANPSLGRTMDESVIEAALSQPVGIFRTEVLCQRVRSLNSAIDMDAWGACGDAAGDLRSVARSVHLFVDAAPDGSHVTATACGLLGDGRPRVEVVGAWETVQAAREAVGDLVRAIRPRSLGWWPGCVLAPDLAALPKGKPAPAADVNLACKELAEQVTSRRLLHSDDPLLTGQAQSASWTNVGSGQRFSAPLTAHVDALYAAAGSVKAARSAPKATGKVRIVVNSAA